MSSSPSRRVVITGMGIVCPLADSAEALYEALLAGESGISHLESVPPDHLSTNVSAEVRQFDGSIDGFGPLDKDRKKAIRKGLKVMCRETQMGVAAAQLALAHAGLSDDDASLTGSLDPERFGVVFGSDYMVTMPEDFSTAVGHCLGEDGGFDYSRWGDEGLKNMSPLWLLKYLPNMPGSHIAIYNDLRGPNNSLTHREAASNLTVAEAAHTIQRGSADRMLAGATGTRVHPMKSIHAVQTEQLAHVEGDPSLASRPFDLHRPGMVIGEGAGVILLEELEAARDRGATIYAEVIGAGSSTVLDHDEKPHLDKALTQAAAACLRDAGASSDEVGHIHAHGLGTKDCDAAEARAIRQVFGARADETPVVAAKANFGNLGAGSGMIELIASVMALRSGVLFPLRNFETPDPVCPIRPATGRDTPAGDSFLTLSVTPQGQAAAVMIRRAARS